MDVLRASLHWGRMLPFCHGVSHLEKVKTAGTFRSESLSPNVGDKTLETGGMMKERGSKALVSAHHVGSSAGATVCHFQTDAVAALMVGTLDCL